MHAMYLKEREGLETLQTEAGFATYELAEDYVYIVDIFTLPVYRNSYHATSMADQIVEKALENPKITWLLGSVDTSVGDPTASMKVLLAYGMKFSHINNNIIYFKKSIRENSWAE